ncbi:predicted protein [Nematostella vectensis]|uniref:G-protein coupled receptors family 1 profile domain-containing protein n=1 Tax=Nematostella vectensis TaxID=45351 RepID=A7SVM9_NEMVE|nr:predicted protein [Nematostella vectensis]|eukprot:XP_001624334.1 predicted protein [Nematostella vectensis]
MEEVNNCSNSLIKKHVEAIREVEPIWGIVFAVLNGVCSVVATLCNGLVIFAVLRKREQRTPSYILLTSQALTDLGVGLVVCPLSVYCIYITNLQNTGEFHNLCDIARYGWWPILFINAYSALNLTAIAADRYMAIHSGLSYSATVTHRRVHITMAIIILVSFALATAFIIVFDYPLYFVYIFLTVTCVILIFIFYSGAFRELRRQLHQVSANGNQSNMNTLKYKKGLWTMVIVYCVGTVSLLCAGLAFSYSLTLKISGNSVKILFIGTTALHVSSCINPILFMRRLGDIRLSCREMLALVLDRLC